MKHIHKIQLGLIILLLVLTLYNTYTLHFSGTREIKNEQEMSAFAESINANAAEIQTVKSNLETMVNFVNAKFENIASAVSAE